MCSVLGRYGDPISVSNDRRYAARLDAPPLFCYYNDVRVLRDTKVNRELKRPIGKWLVDRVTSTR
jgi:hypothetical protein